MSNQGDLQHGRMHVRIEHPKPTLRELITRYLLFYAKSIVQFYSAFLIAMAALEIAGSNGFAIYVFLYPWYGSFVLGLKTLEFMSREALFHLFLDYNLLIVFKRRELLRMPSFWLAISWVAILAATVFYSRGSNDAFVTLGMSSLSQGYLVMYLFKEVDDLGLEMLTIHDYLCKASNVSETVEQLRMSPSGVLEKCDHDVEKTHQLSRQGTLELIAQQVSEMVFVPEGELKHAVKAMVDLTTKITSENPSKEVCSTELKKLYAQLHPSNFTLGSIGAEEAETYSRNCMANLRLFVHERIWAIRYIVLLSRNCPQPHAFCQALKEPVSQAGFKAYIAAFLCLYLSLGLVVITMPAIGGWIYAKSK